MGPILKWGIGGTWGFPDRLAADCRHQEERKRSQTVWISRCPEYVPSPRCPGHAPRFPAKIRLKGPIMEPNPKKGDTGVL
jgi:hypothetical protein